MQVDIQIPVRVELSDTEAKKVTIDFLRREFKLENRFVKDGYIYQFRDDDSSYLLCPADEQKTAAWMVIEQLINNV